MREETQAKVLAIANTQYQLRRTKEDEEYEVPEVHVPYPGHSSGDRAGTNAQSIVTGAVNGTVTDASGAVVEVRTSDW